MPSRPGGNAAVAFECVPSATPAWLVAGVPVQVLLWKKLNVTVPVNASPSPAVICAVSYRFELIGITVLLATVASLALFFNTVAADGVPLRSEERRVGHEC